MDHAIMNHRDCEEKDIIVNDSRGFGLTHYCLAERLMQVEYSKIIKETKETSVVHQVYTSETLIYMLEGGFRGFHNYSVKELLDEWIQEEKNFYEMYDSNSLPWDVFEDDPIITNEEDVKTSA